MQICSFWICIGAYSDFREEHTMSALTTPIVLVPGSPEWRVVHEALAQFVENHAHYIDMECDEKHPSDNDKVLFAKQETAEAVMECFDAVFVALADA
jgi:hypothetical protein